MSKLERFFTGGVDNASRFRGDEREMCAFWAAALE
jgi:hypothetical protein